MKSKQLVKSKRDRSVKSKRVRSVKSKRVKSKRVKSKRVRSKVLKSNKMKKSYFTGGEIAAAAALAIAVGGGVYYINNGEISKLNSLNKLKTDDLEEISKLNSLNKLKTDDLAEKFQIKIRELNSELYNERAKNRKNRKN